MIVSMDIFSDLKGFYFHYLSFKPIMKFHSDSWVGAEGRRCERSSGMWPCGLEEVQAGKASLGQLEGSPPLAPSRQVMLERVRAGPHVICGFACAAPSGHGSQWQASW